MDQYASSPSHSTYCYAELAASFICSLHYFLPPSGFYGVEKDNKRQTHRQSVLMPPFGLLVPPPHHLPIFTPNAISATTLPVYLGLGQAQNNAGLHTRWLGFCYSGTEDPLQQQPPFYSRYTHQRVLASISS